MMQDLLAQNPIIPVITLDREEDALPLVHSLVSGGFKVIEITLRTDAALSAIERIRAQFPDLGIGAGTICSSTQINQAESLGCDFLVSPGATPTLLEEAKKSALPLIPGISTVSEIMLGLELGYQDFKFFPAEPLGGVATLKAIFGPFREVRFCATGGISLHNMTEYLNLPNVDSVGGSWMVHPSLIAQQNWPEIQQLSKTALATATALAHHPLESTA
jgi:2-dehydro-3-deoxyphosphogluconate aldolase / (4S)-4-hydroxy-2-oxoglutarate aldolase